MTELTLAAILLCAAAFFAPVAKRAGLGSVVGYLIAGIVIGPAGIGFVDADEDVDEILHLAEFGVVLLLFLIGLELRPQRLWSMRADIFAAGTAQVAATTAILAFIGVQFGYPLGQSVVVGAALALSSTAFVLQFLGEKGQLAQRHGRMGFAVLLFQDLVAIPLIAFIPIVSNAGTGDPFTLWDLGRMVGVIALVLIVGRYVLHYVYAFVAATGVEEGMTAAALLTVVAVALLMEYVGLSAALGAFLAGVLIGGSEYRHEIEANIAPFERILLGVFFTAVGMALDLGLLIDNPARILIMAFGLVAVKAGVLIAVGLWRGLPTVSALYLGIALAQGGEFAFVVFGVALQNGLMTGTLENELAVAVTLSMAATPILFWIAEQGAHWLTEPPSDKADDMPSHEGGHIIVAGFGPFGQIPARLFAAKGIAFTALDTRAEHIGFLRRFGADVYYGDASRPDLLAAAGAGEARAIILAMNDAEDITRTAQVVRRTYPDLPIYARARDRFHAYELLDLGVTAVQRETFHSSLALAEDVLIGLGEKPADARRAVQVFRDQDTQRFIEDRPHYGDEEKVVESARRSREELERQFTRDRAERSVD